MEWVATGQLSVLEFSSRVKEPHHHLQTVVENAKHSRSGVGGNYVTVGIDEHGGMAGFNPIRALYLAMLIKGNGVRNLSLIKKASRSIIDQMHP